MERNTKGELGVVFKGNVDKSALLVLKHVAKPQVSKRNTSVFKSAQLGFCRLEDTGEEDMVPSPKRLRAWGGHTRAAGTAGRVAVKAHSQRQTWDEPPASYQLCDHEQVTKWP